MDVFLSKSNTTLKLKFWLKLQDSSDSELMYSKGITKVYTEFTKAKKKQH